VILQKIFRKVILINFSLAKLNFFQEFFSKVEFIIFAFDIFQSK